MSKTKGESIGRVAQIGGVRLVEANARTRVRTVDEIPDDSGLSISHGGWVTDGPNEEGDFFVRARMEVKVVGATAEEESKDDPFLSVEVAFELAYRLPPEFKASKEELDDFAAVNGVFNAWPYFREVIQTATGRMNLPPIVIPLYHVTKEEESGQDSERKSKDAAPPNNDDAQTKH
jgi:hypothetical protein